MSQGEWNSGDKERRERPYEYELQRIVRVELADANQPIIDRLDTVERKIDRWEDRAGFLNKVIIVSFAVTGGLAAAYEWLREHLK